MQCKSFQRTTPKPKYNFNWKFVDGEQLKTTS